MASRHQNIDKKVLTIFEILGSYFTDTFFNHIYQSSLSGKNSVTDSYIASVQSYVVGVKTDKQCYEQVVTGAWKYFRDTTGYATLSFADFVDRIVGSCVPADYYGDFHTDQKDELLNNILCDLIAGLAVYTTGPQILGRVIDQHMVTPNVTVRMMQDHAVDTLVAKRIEIQNKFIKKISQSRDHVPMDMVEGMKAAIRKLAKEKADALSRAEKAEADLAELRRTSKKREAMFLRAIDLLKKAKAAGPAAAGASLRVPKEEHIAESTDEPVARHSHSHSNGKHKSSSSAISASFFKPTTVAIPEASEPSDDVIDTVPAVAKKAAPAKPAQSSAVSSLIDGILDDDIVFT